MYKLGLQKAEEPEIKLPTSAGSSEKQKSFRKHLLLPYWLYQSLCVDHNKLWKILKQMGIPDPLTCLFRNLYGSQEATVRTGHGTTDWFQIGKGVHQGCILSPCLLNFCAEYIMWTTTRRIPHAAEQISPCATITEPVLQSLKPVCSRVRALRQAKPSQWEAHAPQESSLPLLQV